MTHGSAARRLGDPLDRRAARDGPIALTRSIARG
jgi:hypothetical protein